MNIENVAIKDIKPYERNAKKHDERQIKNVKSMKKDSLDYKGFKEAKKKYFSKPQVCAVCGTPKKIQIHHIIPNRLTQDQRKQNLIPLCPLHHNRIERMTAELHILFADDYDLELMLLNNILRARQLETYCYLENLKNGQHQD